MNNPHPLVSIFTFCKNGVRSIRRCVESVLSQDHGHLEYVLQDGASTDGTLDILREYAAKDPRIRLVSEHDTCAEVAFFRSLRRCTGEVIGSCLSDEELLPGAVRWAVEQLGRHPEAGAVYGDMHLTDIDGRITGTSISSPFDLLQYLCHEISPPFAASFFRRRCLDAIGLQTRDWMLRAGESELWIRLGREYPIHYEPGFVTKYAVHTGQLSSQHRIYETFLPANIELLDRLFAEPGTLDHLRHARGQAYAGVYLWIAEILWELGAATEARRAVRAARQFDPNRERLKRIEERVSPLTERRLRIERWWLDATRAEREGDGETAYDLYRRLARERHPRRWLAYYRAGSLARRAGRAGYARRAFGRVAADGAVADEHRAGAAFHLGELALESRDRPGAAEWFRRALAWNPSHRGAAARLAGLDQDRQTPAREAPTTP